MIHGDDTATGGNHVDASVGKLKAVQRSFERVRRSLDAALASEAALVAAEDALLRASRAAAETELAANVARHSDGNAGDGSGNSALGTVEAILRGCEKERAKASAAQEKARERVEAAHESASRAVAFLLEVGAAWAESFQASSHGRRVTAAVVRSAQQAARAAFRQLSSAWQVVRGAQEAWVKAARLHGRSVQKASAAAAAWTEAGIRQSTADLEVAEAAREEEMLRRERLSCEAAVADAATARAAVEAQEANHKRRRIELRATAAATQAALKPAKAAEREAAAGRASLLSHYSKKAARGQMKMELTMARSSAKEALLAVRALKEEEYDANQVEEAYQAKKRPRCENTQQG